MEFIGLASLDVKKLLIRPAVLLKTTPLPLEVQLKKHLGIVQSKIWILYQVPFFGTLLRTYA